jgi:hypothetical protein
MRGIKDEPARRYDHQKHCRKRPVLQSLIDEKKRKLGDG